MLTYNQINNIISLFQLVSISLTWWSKINKEQIQNINISKNKNT